MARMGYIRRFSALGALVGALALPCLIVADTGCGIISWCPVNHGAKRHLDREFLAKAAKCEQGDDLVCSSIVADAEKKVKMCQECGGCDGTERYESVAVTAKNKNQCEHHSEGLACAQLAFELDEQAKKKGEYSDEAIRYFQKACTYGDKLACEQASRMSQSKGAAVAAAVQKDACSRACYATAPVPSWCPHGCMSVRSSDPSQCVEACRAQVQCMRSCN